MATMNAKCFLYMQRKFNVVTCDYKWEPDLWTVKVNDDESRVFIREVQVSVETPDDFDPTPRQIAALNKQKEELGRKFAEDVAMLNEKLSKLQALSYEP